MLIPGGGKKGANHTNQKEQPRKKAIRKTAGGSTKNVPRKGEKDFEFLQSQEKVSSLRKGDVREGPKEPVNDKKKKMPMTCLGRPRAYHRMSKKTFSPMKNQDYYKRSDKICMD